MGAAALGRAGSDRAQRGRNGCAADRLLKIVRQAGCLSVLDAAVRMGVSPQRIHEICQHLAHDGLINREKAPGKSGRLALYLMPADEDWRGAVDLPIVGVVQERVIDAIRDLGPEASPSAIGELVGLSAAAVCMSIRRLEAKGLIERRVRVVERLVRRKVRVRELIILDGED